MVAEQDRNKHAPELLSSLRNATKRFNAAREEVQRVITANPDAPLTENELVEIAAAEKVTGKQIIRIQELTEALITLTRTAEAECFADEILKLEEDAEDFNDAHDKVALHIQTLRERKTPAQLGGPCPGGPGFGALPPGPPAAPAPAAVRLPVHELPKFSGQYSEWPSFWDQFSSTIHNQTGLSNAHKLSYLRCCVTGEPLDLIKAFTLTNENYPIAVTILTSRDLTLLTRRWCYGSSWMPYSVRNPPNRETANPYDVCSTFLRKNSRAFVTRGSTQVIFSYASVISQTRR